MWAYDGFVLEIKPDKVTTVINNLMANSLAPLEYEIIL
jgi:signal transduction histidine kinase